MELTDQQVYEIRPREIAAAERDDEDVAYLGFFDPRPAANHYVSLSRSLRETAIHTERDDQKWSCYNGITDVTLEAGLLTIRYDPESASKLGGVETIRVDGRGVTAATWNQVARVLAVMFRDTDVRLKTSG